MKAIVTTHAPEGGAFSDSSIRGRSAVSGGAMVAANNTAEAGLILANAVKSGSLVAEDRTYLSGLVAKRAGIGED